MNKVRVLITALILGAFAAAGAALVAITHVLTDERIAANEREAKLRKLTAIIPSEEVDNDPLEDLIEIEAPDLLGSETTHVFRARSDDRPLAVVLDPVARDGYAGPIKLLVSVLADGTVGGVRVLSHRETPGLGDRIELEKSDWLLGFQGKSLIDPPAQKWKVERDGGVFDQFSGATITPRAIVRTVKNSLLFVQREGRRLYEQSEVKASGDDVSESEDHVARRTAPEDRKSPLP